jgi:hypothetical protein
VLIVRQEARLAILKDTVRKFGVKGLFIQKQQNCSDDTKSVGLQKLELFDFCRPKDFVFSDRI